jgi:multidrug efflux pump subunit AcrA (membrane-fusion protein)
LAELMKGTRPEDIAVSVTKVTNAENSVLDAKRTLTDTLKDSYTKADNAIRNNIDQFFTNARTGNPEINFVVSDQQLRTDIIKGRVNIESTLISWNELILSLDSKDYSMEVAVKSEENLNIIRAFLDKVSFAVNSLTQNYALTQTTITTYRTDVSTARTSINTALSNVSTSREKLESAMSVLNLANSELALARAGSTPEKIEIARAKVLEDEASLALLKHEYSTHFLRAPIAGEVVRQDAKVGEIATPSVSLISIHAKGKLEIEANVPEADVARIQVGDKANVTLDAYGSDLVFEATITSIDSAETLVENVPTYKTTFIFDSLDERVKSGMTANITIITEKRQDVVAVPNRAVYEKDGKKFVEVMNIETQIVESKEVTTGLKGVDGNVEILSGLSGGETVVLPLSK